MRILVPVDGSESADRAAAHAVSLAEGRSDAEIILLNVQNQETLDTSDVSSITSVGTDTRRAGEQSENAFRQAVRLCRAAQVKFTTRSALGRVAETIDTIAREVGADQIVMGSRGLGYVRSVVLGSVSSRVVQLAPMPVTLVK
jgi:nucleotide-binding universal stress UspA family protein